MIAATSTQCNERSNQVQQLLANNACKIKHWQFLLNWICCSTKYKHEWQVSVSTIMNLKQRDTVASYLDLWIIWNLTKKKKNNLNNTFPPNITVICCSIPRNRWHFPTAQLNPCVILDLSWLYLPMVGRCVTLPSACYNYHLDTPTHTIANEKDEHNKTVNYGPHEIPRSSPGSPQSSPASPQKPCPSPIFS